MWGMATFFNKIFDGILYPFKAMHPSIGLLVISIIAGLIMVWIFGKASNQKAILLYKNRLKAHIAEIWLFRDNLIQMLLAVLRVLGNTGIYFLNSLRPMVVMLVPILIIMVMLGVRYEHRMMLPGETVIVSSVVDDAAWARGDAVTLTGSDGVEVISPALRIPQKNEIDWKVRAVKPGTHTVTLNTPSGTVTKEVHIAADMAEAKPLHALASARGRMFSSAFLLFPVERPLPGDCGISKLELSGLPTRDLELFGLSVNWLVLFFIVSMIAGFSIKDLIGVEV
jgi:uncharacterized membrane protein (DUF106 family)